MSRTCRSTSATTMEVDTRSEWNKSKTKRKGLNVTSVKVLAMSELNVLHLSRNKKREC